MTMLIIPYLEGIRDVDMRKVGLWSKPHSWFRWKYKWISAFQLVDLIRDLDEMSHIEIDFSVDQLDYDLSVPIVWFVLRASHPSRECQKHYFRMTYSQFFVHFAEVYDYAVIMEGVRQIADSIRRMNVGNATRTPPEAIIRWQEWGF